MGRFREGPGVVSLQGAQKQVGEAGRYPDAQDRLLVAPSRDGSSQCHGSGSMSWVSLVEKAV